MPNGIVFFVPAKGFEKQMIFGTRGAFGTDKTVFAEKTKKMMNAFLTYTNKCSIL